MSKPIAYLFVCWNAEDGQQYATIDPNDTTWLAQNQWTGAVRIPLVKGGETEQVFGLPPPKWVLPDE
jgi:hypothetical protein